MNNFKRQDSLVVPQQSDGPISLSVSERKRERTKRVEKEESKDQLVR